VPVVVVAVAPRCLASWIAYVPTPPGAAVDEHVLAGLQVRSLDERLPRAQCDERHGGRLGHEEVPGLDREIVLVHGDALGEGADAAVARSRVDVVAHGEARHGRPDAGDDAGEVVPADG
jgi:hypothetical protein